MSAGLHPGWRTVLRWLRRLGVEQPERSGTEDKTELIQPTTELAPGIQTEIGPPFYGSYSDHVVLTGDSPHEYIHFLLTLNGGRMRQSALVKATGWAASTTSQYLSEMEATDQLVRYQLGGEKVAALPDQVPSAVISAERS